MTREFRLTLIWLAGAVITTLITLQMTSASLVGGHYGPVGHDAFYHARRVLDAVQSGHVYQFDAKMHVPEGDWVTWPWAYDAGLAMATRGLVFLTGAGDPVPVLMHLPVLLGVLGVAVVVCLGATLRLQYSLIAVAIVCFALHTFTQYFGVGALDHHGAEQLATMITLLLGMRWFRVPESRSRAAVLGAFLGATIGIHAGLFILQVPLLAAVFVTWARDRPLPRRATIALALGLLGGTLAILLPSATFWQARFQIYYLSWFQLYIAFATAAALLFMSLRAFTRGRFLSLAVLAVVLALPLLTVLGFSTGFLTGRLAEIQSIDEIRSPFQVAADDAGGVRRINQVYTLAVWVAPLIALLSGWMAWRAKTADLRYFWLMSAFGLVLLLMQMRLGSFGVMFLYMPVLLLVSQALVHWPHLRTGTWALLLAALALAYYPTVRYQVLGTKVPAMDQQFTTLQPLLPMLIEACRRDPGVVLADPGDGHLVRYFTSCTVIANNFRLTPMDISKIAEAKGLISLPYDEMRRRAPEVKYILARMIEPAETSDPALFKQLLAPNPPLPDGVENMVELRVTRSDGTAEKFFGLYRIVPPGGAPLDIRPDELSGGLR